MPAQTSRTLTITTDYQASGVNLPSGNLTATVAASDTYVVGSSNTATVAMKLPSSGPPALTEIVQPAPVVEGGTLTVPVRVRTAAGVVAPRSDFTVAIYTEARTATINSDYSHISRNLQFIVDDWTAIGAVCYSRSSVPASGRCRTTNTRARSSLSSY